MADAGVELHILQRVAGHQDPAVTSRDLHPDTQAMLDAGTVFSAWWSGTGPERPSFGVVQGGKPGAEKRALACVNRSRVDRSG